MANPKQQSSEAPQTSQPGQLGATGTGRTPAPGRGARSVPARRGSYEPAWYGEGGSGGPFALMRRISDEMDRLFESFGMGATGRNAGSGAFPANYGAGLQTLWTPRIEVCERNGKLLIQADLPGVRKEDLNVRLEQDAVVIEGERRQESEREEQGFYHSERSYGSFHRVIPLPEGIDGEQAKARFRDGILDIELPVPQQRQRGRTLTIEDGGTSGEASERSGTAPASRQQG